MAGRAVGLSAAVVVLVAGCGAHRSVAHDGASTSDPERAAALKAARTAQATVPCKLLVATYKPNAGERGQSNTGHSCSGRTVQVRLLWNGASFNHGASTGESAKDQHQALVVTADATSGVPCLIGADYGATASDPRPGEIYLYGPRKDLVPTQ